MSIKTYIVDAEGRTVAVVEGTVKVQITGVVAFGNVEDVDHLTFTLSDEGTITDVYDEHGELLSTGCAMWEDSIPAQAEDKYKTLRKLGEMAVEDIPFAYEGTVSHGTMRMQDLIPAFLTTLSFVDPDAYMQLSSGAFPHIPAYVYDEGDACPWWHSEDASNLFEELFEALNAAAPEDYYFGAHPGDGSDYGYWRNEE